MAELLGHYSKFGTELGKRHRRLVKVLERGDPVPDRAVERRWVAHRLEDRPDVDVAQIVREYEAGDGCCTLAVSHGLSENGVLALLKRQGVMLRPPGKVTPADVREMARLRERGWTYRAIGERFGVTRVAVKRRIRQLAVEPAS
ncbi:MAG: hypothetical protein ACRCYU_01325 [Nocardioides sp.]